MIRDLLEVVVPVRWSGRPFQDGSRVLAWLGADGLELPASGDEPPPEAVRLRFRTALRMADRVRFERAIDDATGGPEWTNDLEVAFVQLQTRLGTRYEQRLWPEGRPDVETDAEVTAQLRAIHEEYLSDLWRMSGPDETPEQAEARIEAAAYDRVSQQRRLCRDTAEMFVLIEGPAEWRNLNDREWQDADHIDAVIGAYRNARARREAERGNVKRSAA